MAENINDLAVTARDVLEKLLSLMGVSASVVSAEEALAGNDEGDASINLNVEGDDLGILIGWRGQTLSCIQYILRIIAGHQTGKWLPITVDVEGYKRRRYEGLQALARRIAEQVKVNRMPFTLESMPAYERRVVHLALAENPDVTTESSGEGDARRVIVLPV